MAEPNPAVQLIIAKPRDASGDNDVSATVTSVEDQGSQTDQQQASSSAAGVDGSAEASPPAMNGAASSKKGKNKSKSGGKAKDAPQDSTELEEAQAEDASPSGADAEIQSAGSAEASNKQAAPTPAPVVVQVHPPSHITPPSRVPEHKLSPRGSPRGSPPGKAGAAHVRDRLASQTGVPRVRPQWTDRYMKLLVAGETGLGKTTFVGNLFAAYSRDPNFAVSDASAQTSQATFSANPAELCTEIIVQDEQRLVTYHYLVQDTPGHSDSGSVEDNITTVLDHIDACNWSYMEAEAAADRAVPVCQLADARVDAVLFFIPPHRLKEVDVRFMEQLAERAPVIPILSKADSMTTDELDAFRKHVKAALGKGVMHHFSGEVLAEAAVLRECPPFAVVASNTMDKSVGRFWPVRRYPWGTCEALSSSHSDLPALRALLFEAGYEELKGLTETRYLAYRSSHLHQLTEGKGGGGSNRTPQRARRVARARHLVEGAAVALIGYGLWQVAPFLTNDGKRNVVLGHIRGRASSAVDEAKHSVGVVAERVTSAVHSTAEAARVKAEEAAADLEAARKKAEKEAEEAAKKANKKHWWQL